jgi:hypothetical protein
MIHAHLHMQSQKRRTPCLQPQKDMQLYAQLALLPSDMQGISPVQQRLQALSSTYTHSRRQQVMNVFTCGGMCLGACYASGVTSCQRHGAITTCALPYVVSVALQTCALCYGVSWLPCSHQQRQGRRTSSSRSVSPSRQQQRQPQQLLLQMQSSGTAPAAAAGRQHLGPTMRPQGASHTPRGEVGWTQRHTAGVCVESGDAKVQPAQQSKGNTQGQMTCMQTRQRRTACMCSHKNRIQGMEMGRSKQG